MTDGGRDPDAAQVTAIRQRVEEPQMIDVSGLERSVENACAVIDHLRGELAEAQRQLAAKDEALRKYGEHEPVCPRHFYGLRKGNPQHVCTCGFLAALSPASPATSPEETR